MGGLGPDWCKCYWGSDDEYRSYVPSILKLLQEGADVPKIAKLLQQHANINMGLHTSLEDHIDVAKKIKSGIN